MQISTTIKTSKRSVNTSQLLHITNNENLMSLVIMEHLATQEMDPRYKGLNGKKLYMFDKCSYLICYKLPISYLDDLISDQCSTRLWILYKKEFVGRPNFKISCLHEKQKKKLFH